MKKSVAISWVELSRIPKCEHAKAIRKLLVMAKQTFGEGTTLLGVTRLEDQSTKEAQREEDLQTSIHHPK